jgi:predicted hydrolase (HD superfamily)
MSTHLLNRNSFGDPKNNGNLMPLDEAHALLNEWVPNERLRLHMKQVAANMKAWAVYSMMLTGKNIPMIIAGLLLKNWKEEILTLK